MTENDQGVTRNSGTERSLSARIKCRTLGHDWMHYRDRGERRCLRCGSEEEYSVEETHADEGAEKGATRYRIEDGTLYIEQYTVTACGDDSEYWQWSPTAGGPADEENLKQLVHEIKRYTESDT